MEKFEKIFTKKSILFIYRHVINLAGGNKSRAKQGFSLIETIVYIALSSIMLTLSIQFFFAFTIVSAKNEATLDTEYSGETLLQKIDFSVEHGIPIVLPDSVAMTTTTTNFQGSSTSSSMVPIISFSKNNHIFQIPVLLNSD